MALPARGGLYRRILLIGVISAAIIVLIWSYMGVNFRPMKTTVIELTPTTNEKVVKP